MHVTLAEKGTLDLLLMSKLAPGRNLSVSCEFAGKSPYDSLNFLVLNGKVSHESKCILMFQRGAFSSAAPSDSCQCCRELRQVLGVSWGRTTLCVSGFWAPHAQGRRRFLEYSYQTPQLYRSFRKCLTVKCTPEQVTLK